MASGYPCRHAAKARTSCGSPRRVTELASEARLLDAQAARWSREIIGAAEEQIANAQKDWHAQKAANARWGNNATGGL